MAVRTNRLLPTPPPITSIVADCQVGCGDFIQITRDAVKNNGDFFITSRVGARGTAVIRLTPRDFNDFLTAARAFADQEQVVS